MLCGPEPRDAAELQRVGTPPSTCWFVDHKERGALAHASSLLPGAHTFYGRIEVLLKRLESPVFVNLDLMSHPAKVEPILVLAMQKVATGGVVAFTFCKGRESKHGTLERLVQQRAQTFEEARWGLLAEIVKKVQRPCTELLRLSYRDNVMAMGVVAWGIK